MPKTAQDLTRKELKGPDRFQQAAGQAASWLGAHQKQLAAGVVGALGAVAVAVAISAWLGHRDEQAGSELGRVTEAIQGDISQVPIPGSSRPIFRSEEERQRAIAAAAADVRSRFSSSRAAATAALASGDANLRLGEWDRAVADYEVFLSAAASDSLRFAALEGIARAHEGKGELAQAVQSWERAGTGAASYRDRAEIERARVLAKMGRADEARKVLSGFDEAFKDSLLKVEASELLARLAAR